MKRLNGGVFIVAVSPPGNKQAIRLKRCLQRFVPRENVSFRGAKSNPDEEGKFHGRHERYD